MIILEGYLLQKEVFCTQHGCPPGAGRSYFVGLLTGDKYCVLTGASQKIADDLGDPVCSLSLDLLDYCHDQSMPWLFKLEYPSRLFLVEKP